MKGEGPHGTDPFEAGRGGILSDACRGEHDASQAEALPQVLDLQLDPLAVTGVVEAGFGHHVPSIWTLVRSKNTNDVAPGQPTFDQRTNRLPIAS